MISIDEDNIEAMNGVKRLYTVTPSEVADLYTDWAIPENSAVSHHISEIAGLLKEKENVDGIAWDLDIKRLVLEFREGWLEIEEIRDFFNRMVGRDVLPIGSIDNDHATILIDYDLNYYVNVDNMLWSNGSGFNEFLSYRDGRKKFIRLK